MKDVNELEWDNSWVHPPDVCEVLVAKNNHPDLHAVVSMRIGGFGMVLEADTARVLADQLNEAADQIEREYRP